MNKLKLTLHSTLSIIFFAFIVKPIVWIILGLNLRYRERLPKKGPAVIAANHNSHLDALVLMSLYPLSQLRYIKPVAAADYFLKNCILKWFALNILNIIPIFRGIGTKDALFKASEQALKEGYILIIFPEGSRGEAEKIGEVKRGLFYINQTVCAPIVPIMMRGLGLALPRGEALFVPFNCDIIIGETLSICHTAQELTELLKQSYQKMSLECLTQIDNLNQQ